MPNRPAPSAALEGVPPPAMESPRLITGEVPIRFVSDPPAGAGAPAGAPDPGPGPAGFGSGGAASKTLGPKAPPIAPISAVADDTRFFFWYGDAPAFSAVPSRRAAEEVSRASAKFHVAALASHSAHRRIEPVTFPSRDARRAPRRGDGLHAGDAASVASTFVSEEASLLATVHPQSASAVAARRRAGLKEISRDELLVERSVSTDVALVARRARRLATAAGANRPEMAVPLPSSSPALCVIAHTSGTCSSSNNASLRSRNSTLRIVSGTRGNRATDAGHVVPRHPQLGSWFWSSLGCVMVASFLASSFDAVGGTANSRRALHDSHSSVSTPTHVQPLRAQSTGRNPGGLANQTAGRNVWTRRR
mmetsp:Transcript_15397/g.64935  ORF Transcript_15397/g.64935 Transcript_15397/m.64935 type:complete len:364 (+) Transcript_15397:735-1826(+)